MRYLSLFTGIGGFELGIGEQNECVGYSEIDKYAVATYQKHFPSHTNYGDMGRTFDTIISTLDELGYDLQWQVCNSKDFGVPQNRERIFIVGHLRGYCRPEVFPLFGADSEDTQSLGDDESGTQGIATRHLGRNGGLKSPIASTLQVAEVPHIVQINQPKHSNDRVYDPEGISPTLNTMQGGNRQPFIQVPEATKQGYAEATVGDSINLSVPNSKTRRGRVGKGIAQTLDTGMQQYTISRTVRSGGRNLPHGSKQNWDSYEVEGRIRRLTPIECERLQGFPDGWTEGVSDSQRYKMLGNAVTVNVIRAIAERLSPTDT